MPVFSSSYCMICKNIDATISYDRPIQKCACLRCGTYSFDAEAGWLDIASVDHMVRLSGWTRDQNDSGITYPNITQNLSRRISQMHLPALRERSNAALKVISRTWPGLEDWYDSHDFASSLELQGRSYSHDMSHAMVLIHILKADGSLRHDDRATGLSVKGLLTVEALEVSKTVSKQGFVAMSFDPSLRDLWIDGFAPAIQAAGFRPLRIDNKDYVGGISDEIIAEIRKSRFVVVDYTKQANGVYFEAGFALGIGLTVIPTCHVDEVNKLHFDIRHLNTLLWQTPSDLVSRLSNRIATVVGSE